MMSPASGISMPIVNVMPCTADTSGLVRRRRRPNGSTGSGPSGVLAVGVGPEEQRHVEPGRRVVAGEREHADPQVGVLVEAGHRGAELAGDLRGERVLLLDAVDSHVQHVVVDHRRVHLAVRVAVIGGSGFRHGTDSTSRLHDETHYGRDDMSVPTALVVLVPEAEPVVAAHRLRHDPAAADGVPAHVTVLYPFRTEPDDTTLEAVAAIAAAVPAFDRRSAPPPASPAWSSTSTPSRPHPSTSSSPAAPRPSPTARPTTARSRTRSPT